MFVSDQIKKWFSRHLCKKWPHMSARPGEQDEHKFTLFAFLYKE